MVAGPSRKLEILPRNGLYTDALDWGRGLLAGFEIFPYRDVDSREGGHEFVSVTGEFQGCVHKYVCGKMFNITIFFLCVHESARVFFIRSSMAC